MRMQWKEPPFSYSGGMVNLQVFRNSNGAYIGGCKEFMCTYLSVHLPHLATETPYKQRKRTSMHDSVGT
jgi:hypothetical protein